MSKILIADDDQAMLYMVEQVLKQEGYSVLSAKSYEDAQVIIQYSQPDLFLVDINLPDKDGVTLCRYLRNNSATANAPIIFLTGHHNLYSVTEALDAGGDDYMRKPFAIRELTARIRAHLRRIYTFEPEESISLQIMPDTYQVYVDNREVIVTPIEFDLLRFMCKVPQKWHGTQELLAGVWNYPSGVGDTALVRNHIRNLRRKLEQNPDHPEIIQSRHGRGYSIQANVEVTMPYPA